MKHSIAIKFLTVVLTACALVSAVAGTVGIVAIERAGLYVNRLDELQGHEYESIARTIAKDYVNLYAAKTLGSVPYPLRTELYSDPTQRSDANSWCVQLKQKGVVISQVGAPWAQEHHAAVEEFTFTPLYPIVSLISPDRLEQQQEETESVSESRKMPVADTKIPEDYLYCDQLTRFENGKLNTYYLYYYEAPEYTVSVYLQEDVLESSSLHILTTIYPYRYGCIAVLALGLILFGAGMVFLLWSAGITKDGIIRPGGINRMPLDLHFLFSAVTEYGLIQLLLYLLDWMGEHGPHPGNLSLIMVNLLAITLPLIGFFYAASAQSKLGNHYCWRHCALRWCGVQIGRGLRFLWRGSCSVSRLLPLTWQWLLTAMLMAVSLFLLCVLTQNGNAFASMALVVCILICGGIVLYGAYAFGTLMRGVEKMRQGDLSHKIPTRYLWGNYRLFAQELNTLSEAAKQSAEHEMRSERMKSELITNVSHDIKTPLTSIINFVDLLQKPHTPQQQGEYLEVLARQSSRMKKLIEDLMELSKASTGNITVNIAQMDAVETVNQALGEFSDKLNAAGITPVFQPPKEPMWMLADGRLVWRVLSNLLSNAVKYALPDTRLYVDLVEVDKQVLLSLKNVSKQPLTMAAEDLLERFVRGDTARNSEGSGLGLNIAKNLMEVQNGQMQLLLDGDLFKVTLIFPAN